MQLGDQTHLPGTHGYGVESGGAAGADEVEGDDGRGPPARYVLAFMGFLAFINIYMTYLSLSISLPVMLNHTDIHLTFHNRSALEDQEGVFFDSVLLDDNSMPVQRVNIWDNTQLGPNGARSPALMRDHPIGWGEEKSGANHTAVPTVFITGHELGSLGGDTHRHSVTDKTRDTVMHIDQHLLLDGPNQRPTVIMSNFEDDNFLDLQLKSHSNSTKTKLTSERTRKARSSDVLEETTVLSQDFEAEDTAGAPPDPSGMAKTTSQVDGPTEVSNSEPTDQITQRPPHTETSAPATTTSSSALELTTSSLSTDDSFTKKVIPTRSSKEFNIVNTGSISSSIEHATAKNIVDVTDKVVTNTDVNSPTVNSSIRTANPTPPSPVSGVGTSSTTPPSPVSGVRTSTTTPPSPVSGVGTSTTTPPSPVSGVGTPTTTPLSPVSGVGTPTTTPPSPVSGVGTSSTTPPSPVSGVGTSTTTPPSPMSVVESPTTTPPSPMSVVESPTTTPPSPMSVVESPTTTPPSPMSVVESPTTTPPSPVSRAETRSLGIETNYSVSQEVNVKHTTDVSKSFTPILFHGVTDPKIFELLNINYKNFDSNDDIIDTGNSTVNIDHDLFSFITDKKSVVSSKKEKPLHFWPSTTSPFNSTSNHTHHKKWFSFGDFFTTTTASYPNDVVANVSEHLRVQYIEKIFSPAPPQVESWPQQPIFTNATNMTVADGSGSTLVVNMTGHMALLDRHGNVTKHVTLLARHDNMTDSKELRQHYTFANDSARLHVTHDGAIHIDDVKGNITINDSIRNLTINNVSGNLTIKDVRGNLTINSISGMVTIMDSWGNTTVRNVTGHLIIDDIFGLVSIEGVTGNVSIDEAAGNTTVVGVWGAVVVDEVLGVLSLREVQGRAEVVGVGGHLTASDVSGQLTVVGVRRRGELTVDGVTGELTIENAAGGVTVSNVTGRLRELTTVKRGYPARLHHTHWGYGEEQEAEDNDENEEEEEDDYEYESGENGEEEESNEDYEDLQEYLIKNNCTRRFNATPEDVDILCYVNGSLTARFLSDIELGSSSSSSSSSEEGNESLDGENESHGEGDVLYGDEGEYYGGDILSGEGQDGLIPTERLRHLGNRTSLGPGRNRSEGIGMLREEHGPGLQRHPSHYNEQSDEYSSEEFGIPIAFPDGSSPATHGEIRLQDEFPSTVCYHPRMVERLPHLMDGTLTWSPTAQHHLSVAYYWGLLVSQAAGAWVAGAVGGKKLLLGGVMAGGLLMLLTPALAPLGPYWVFAVRLAVGLTQGCSGPAMHMLLARWAPPMERTAMVAFTYSGVAVGAAVGGPLAAWLVRVVSWRALHYCQGCCALLWCLCWQLLCYESPRLHPRIGQRELRHISTSLGHQHAGRALPVPWGALLKSRHVLAIVIAQATTSWMWYTLYHHVTFYASTALHVPVKQVQVAWVAALLAGAGVGVGYAFLADWARRARKLSTIVIRRGAHTLCTVVTVACLIGLAQARCHYAAVLACGSLALAIGMPAAASASLTNSLDLAPNHAAAIQGLAGTAAALASLVAPSYKLYLITGQATLERWRTLWYTVAIFLVIGSCLYFLLASAKEQVWNRPLSLVMTRPGSADSDDEEHRGQDMAMRRTNLRHNGAGPVANRAPVNGTGASNGSFQWANNGPRVNTNGNAHHNQGYSSTE